MKEKKESGCHKQPDSSIKHYYKIQNLEGILETFFIRNQSFVRTFGS